MPTFVYFCLKTGIVLSMIQVIGYLVKNLEKGTVEKSRYFAFDSEAPLLKRALVQIKYRTAQNMMLNGIALHH